jgi:putative FmdB family regulatory protein
LRKTALISAAAEERSTGSRSGTTRRVRLLRRLKKRLLAMTERRDQRVLVVAAVWKKIMPEYDFECGGCGETVTVEATIKEKEAGLACPHCGSRDIHQIFSPIGVINGCASSPSKAPG